MIYFPACLWVRLRQGFDGAENQPVFAITRLTAIFSA